MRVSSGERFRSFSPSPVSITPLRAVALATFGVTLGVVGTLVAAPLAVFANDDAGIRGLIMRDGASRAATRAQAFAYPRNAGYASAPRGVSYYFQPIVRSFAPEPKLRQRPPLPQPILTGYAPKSRELFRAMDETGAPPRPEQTHAQPKRPPSIRRHATTRAPDRVAAAQSRRAVCVRTCDGYFFPMGSPSSDLAAQESLCQASCPGAPAKLFTIEAGGAIENAVSRDLRRYTSLPAAFAYQKSRSASCTCHQTAQQTHISIMRDTTLRPGDTVVTGERAVVFNGATSWPYRPSDFSDFRVSGRLNAAQKREIDSRVGVTYAANLLKPYNVAKAREITPVAAVEIVRPQQVSELVRRVDGGPPAPRPANMIVTVSSPSSPRPANVIVAVPGPSSAIRVVERGAAPGFIIR
ncbi:DUF2865 domain-containing protein [Terrarubrum flagellatum]|uniref:DUF2865 domain-containing protein n=1 Tax=Terrirubrum flagellatum TaxID=2895980 RepID=UPI003145099D